MTQVWHQLESGMVDRVPSVQVPNPIITHSRKHAWLQCTLYNGLLKPGNQGIPLNTLVFYRHWPEMENLHNSASATLGSLKQYVHISSIISSRTFQDYIRPKNGVRIMGLGPSHAGKHLEQLREWNSSDYWCFWRYHNTANMNDSGCDVKWCDEPTHDCASSIKWATHSLYKEYFIHFIVTRTLPLSPHSCWYRCQALLHMPTALVCPPTQSKCPARRYLPTPNQTAECTTHRIHLGTAI